MQKKLIFKFLAAVTALTLLLSSVPAPAEETGEWTNILLLGCDSYTKNTPQRTDSMIILSVNMNTRQVKMTSIMRDTWLQVPGASSHRKLTELCAVGGPELTIRAINENFGMNLEKYALISMAGIAEIVDLIGGIEIDITESERKAINRGLFNLSSLSGMEEVKQSGENVHLNGNQATAFARIRMIDSDYVRTGRQRTVLLAVANKLKYGANPATLLTIVTTLMSYVQTNMNLTDLMALAGLGLEVELEDVEEFRVPIDGSFESGMYQGYWSIRPNFETNARALHDFIYGGGGN